MDLFAHSPNQSGQWQTLDEHLRNVAAMARDFGARFDAAELCYNAGLWHDIGKADLEWQRYLRESHAGTRARGHGPDHKAAGAAFALQSPDNLPAAWLIHAHHGGLQTADDLKGFMRSKGALPGAAQARAAITSIVPELAATPSAIPLPAAVSGDELASELWMRMAFSALVDADSLDTERHNISPQLPQRGSTVAMAELWDRFATYHADNAK